MKRILRWLLCTAMFLCVLSQAALAEETPKSAAKLGIEKGDILSFAGKDGTPIYWRVIDADKTNVENTDGMLLLSEDTVEKVAVNTLSCTDEESMKFCLQPTYIAFYNKYFSSDYRDAVIKTSVVDTSVSLGTSLFRFYGELLDDTVFALSISEAQTLGLDERKYDNIKWLLRSVRRRRNTLGKYIYEIAYVDSSVIDSENQNAKITDDEIKSDNTTAYYFRPAVNVDKTTLAQLDGKPLLLPAGEYSEANNTLVPLGTASAWKLAQRNYTVTVTQTTVTVHDDGTYAVKVGTNLASPDENDFISLIIQKSDGSLSHYARFAMTAAETTIDLALPDGFDRENDTLYVFYENYQGALSGSVGEITEICPHMYRCIDLDADVHRFTCQKCGDTYDEDHIYTVTERTDKQHTLGCTVCGNTKNENHTYGKITPEAFQNVNCTGCGKQAPFMAVKGTFDEAPVFNGTEAAIRTEYDENSVSVENCTITYRTRLFSNSSVKAFDFIPTGETAGVSFHTTTPIRATGFRMVINRKDTAPDTVTLYGRNNSSDAYKKIGSAFLKSILSEKFDYYETTYAFLFTDTTGFAAYTDFKFEMDNTSSNSIEMWYLGLLSDKGSAFSVAADGALVEGNPPSVIYPGENLTLTLISKNGHPKLTEMRLNIVGEDNWERLYNYSVGTGVFTLPGSKIKGGKEYILNVTCADKSLSVNFDLTRATVIDKTEDAVFGKEYQCVFGDANGETAYAPTKQDIKVLCGGTDITDKCSYIDNTLTIPGQNVMGNLTITANEKFSVQKDTSNIRVDRAGESTRWYNGDDGDSSELLKDINAGGDVTVTFIHKGDLSLNLNFNWTFTAGNITFDLSRLQLYTKPITVRSGANLTIKNGKYNCNLPDVKCVVESGASLTLENAFSTALNVKGKLVVDNTSEVLDGKILLQQGSEFVLKRGEIGDLALYQPSRVVLYSGTVRNINSYKDDSDAERLPIDYDGLLGEGCEYYNISSPDAFAKGEPTGFSVKCSHSVKNIDPKTGSCICGEPVSEILTENDGKITLYGDILEAMEYASQNPHTTIRIFRDITVTLGESAPSSGYIPFTGDDTTLDLNGHTLEIADSNVDFSVTGSLTVTGNGTLNTLLRAEKDSSLIIESGTFREVTMISKDVTLYGGKFTLLRKDTRNDVFGAYLGEHKAYRDAETGKFNTSEYEGLSLRYFLVNVEVTDVPFIINSQPVDIYVDAGEELVTVWLDVQINEAYKDAVEYSWSALLDTTQEYSQYLSSGLREDSKFNYNIVTDELDGGAHLVYQCYVSCNGYQIYSNSATITVGTGKPVIEFSYLRESYVIDPAGNDGVLIAAAYDGDRFLGMASAELTKDCGVMKPEEVIAFSEIVPEEERGSISEIRMFFWDSLNGLRPLTEKASIPYDTNSSISSNDKFS